MPSGKRSDPNYQKWKRRNRIFSILFLAASILLGCVALVLTGGGIFVVIDQVRFVVPIVGTSLIYEGAVIVTVASGITILISFIGCCMSRSSSNRNLTAILVGLLMIVFVLDWTGATLAIVYKKWVSDQTRTYMRNSIQTQYGLNDTSSELMTASWDFAQQKWYCCGVEDNSWGLYKSSNWYTLQPGMPEADKPLVPVSCCRKNQYGRYVSIEKCQIYRLGPPSKQAGELNEALFYRGCFEASKQSLDTVANAVIVNGVIMYIVMLCFVISAFFFHRHGASF